MLGRDPFQIRSGIPGNGEFAVENWLNGSRDPAVVVVMVPGTTVPKVASQMKDALKVSLQMPEQTFSPVKIILDSVTDT